MADEEAPDAALGALVARIRATGHAVTPADLEALIASGVERTRIFDALIAAADGASSRAFHRALAVLRDLARR